MKIATIAGLIYFATAAVVQAQSTLEQSARAHSSPLLWVPLCEPGSGGAMVSLSVDPRDSKRIVLGGDMLSVGSSVDGAESWQGSNGLTCFEDGSFTWHPREKNTVWVGTASGPFVSHDGGKTWTAKRDGFPKLLEFGYAAPVEKVLFDPADADRMLAIGGSSRHWDVGQHAQMGVVWESVDAGEHWHRLTTVTATGSSNDANAKGVNFWLADYAAKSKVLLYGIADTAGLIVSEDGGRSWSLRRGSGLPEGAHPGRIAISPVDANTLWAGVADYRTHMGNDKDKSRSPGGVFKSIDGGKTWVDSSTGLARVGGDHKSGDQENLVSRYEGISVSPADANVLYVCDTAWNAGVIYKSEDAGSRWKAVATKGNIGQTNAGAAGAGTGGVGHSTVAKVDTAYFAGLAMNLSVCDPTDANTAYFVNTETLVGTRDGGKTFQDLTSRRVGTNWQGRGYSGLCCEHFAFDPYHDGRSIAMGMDAARAWVSDDHCTSWQYPLTEPNPWFGGFDAAFARDGHVFTTSGQYGFWGIGRSTDNAKTWTLLGGAKHGLPELKAGGGRGSEGVYVNPDDSSHVWAVVDGKLFRTTDGGENWTPVRTGSTPHFVAGDPKNPGRIFVTSDKNLYVGDDGEHLIPKGGPKPAGRLHFDTAGLLYVCSYESSRGGLWRYDPAEEQWTRLSDDRQIMDVAVDPTDPRRLAVATNMMPYADVQRATGVWISADAGKSWTQENTGLAMTRGGAISFDPFDSTRLVFGSFGRGFFKASWPRGYKPVGNSKSYLCTKEDVKFAAIDETDGKPVLAKLLNGDMTAGSGLPEHWDGKWGDVTATRDTATFKSAPASLCVQTTKDHAAGQAMQMLDVAGGPTLRVKGFVKSAGQVKVNFAVQSYDDGWHAIDFQQVKYAQDDSDWSAADKEIHISDKAAHVGIVLLVEGTGRAWLDDVTVTLSK